MKSRYLICLLFGSAVPAAHAQDHAVGAKIGFLGLGVEYSYLLNDLITIRGAIYGSTYSFDDTNSGIDYTLDLEFDSLSVGVDFHPTEGPLRLSVGALSNDNGIAAQSNPTQSFDIGGTTYSAADVGTLRAAIGFDSVAPYASIGWDWSRTKSFGVSLDLGVISQGSPTVRLSADGPILGDPSFASDIAAEEIELQNSLDDFDLFPFAALGFMFRF